jgi:hypothetical protein
MYLLMAPDDGKGFSLMALECALTALAVIAPHVGIGKRFGIISRIERALKPLDQRPLLASLSVAFSVVLLRIAILPILPAPLPFLPDDFSNLLAADTFLHGRLTNPTPAMWTHFESIQIDLIPTYNSMYFPSQGLFLAAGKLIFGHFWLGQLLASALMCGALCWMLQAWLPPSWALLGGFIAVLRLGLFSYWANTYSSAGCIAAMGGALVLGGLPRFMRTERTVHAILMALGLALLALSRPFEGILLFIPVAIILGRWLFHKKRHAYLGVLVRRTTPALLLLGAAAIWLGYYNYRNFGSPSILPYAVNRATYAAAPYFIWQPQRSGPNYRHEQIRRFYEDVELPIYKDARTVRGFLAKNFLSKPLLIVRFFAGFALLPPLLMSRRVLLDRRVRLLVLCLPFLAAGLLIEVFFVQHYSAPFTSIFYALGLQAMRHLWQWRVRGRTVGMFTVRFCVGVCVVMAVVRPFNRRLHLPIIESQTATWSGDWCGPDHFGVERDAIARELQQLPGNQLAVVRYSAEHDSHREWVYNSADIEHSKVIWAREMDPERDRELLEYFRDRKVWLVQPDKYPDPLTAYPLPEQVTVGSR